MGLPSEDDREAIDRAFAEMMSGYHLTAERPERTAETTTPAPAQSPPGSDTSWADQHPLFRTAEPTTPAPVEDRRVVPTPEPERQARRPAEREEPERYVPEPLPPLRRPGVPALLGWIGIGYAVLVVLVAAVGVHPPTWIGWLAVGSFITGFAILITQLPRNRPPDAGDGAVL